LFAKIKPSRTERLLVVLTDTHSANDAIAVLVDGADALVQSKELLDALAEARFPVGF